MPESALLEQHDLQQEDEKDIADKSESVSRMSDKARSLVGKISNVLRLRSNPDKVFKELADTGNDENESTSSQNKVASGGKEMSEAEQDSRNAEVVADLQAKAGIFKKALEVFKSADIQTKGTILAAVLGAAATFANTPIPPDMLGDLSAAVGGASLGSGIGETNREKARNALIGAGVGVGLAKGVGSFTEEPSLRAAVGFVDDLPTVGVGISAGIKAVRNRPSRMRAPEIKHPRLSEELVLTS